MRILFSFHTKDYSGGAERCLNDLILALHAAHPNWEFFAIYPAEGALSALLEPYMKGYEVVKPLWWLVPSKKKDVWHRLKFRIRQFVRLRPIRRYIQMVQPDVVVTNTLVMSAVAVAARQLKIPHCWFIHEVPSFAENALFLFGERATLRKVDALSGHVFVPSSFTREYYSSWINPAKMSVLDQAIEPKIYPRDKQRMTPSLGPVLCMLGRFEDNKGQHIALEAVRLLRESLPGLRLMLVGASPGEYTNQLRRTIAENRLEECVSVIAHTPDPHIYFSRADVVVSCSRYETFGRVVVEALRLGLPVIASDIPASREFITPGQNGFLFRRDDASDLAEQIRRISDPEVLARLGENAARTLGDRFTSQQFASQFVESVEGLLRDSRRE